MSATKSPSGSLGSCVPFVLILSFALAGARLCRAQGQTEQSQDQVLSQTQEEKPSVAEAAREERLRKQSHQKARHVYTAEDLRREHILSPQDRAALAARQQPTAPVGAQKLPEGATVPEDGPAARPSSNSAEVPLGDIARRLRREKESQQLLRSAEYPLPFADASVLASPSLRREPLLPSVTVAPPTVVVPSPRVAARFAPHRPAGAAVSPTSSGKLTIVTVKAGDSLSKLAAAHLGDGHRWQELLTRNPGLPNPNLLEVGSQILVPASLAPPHARVNYQVRHGETLWTIAQTQLGHAAAWSSIATVNPDLGDANLIHEGQVLLLPASSLRENAISGR